MLLPTPIPSIIIYNFIYEHISLILTDLIRKFNEILFVHMLRKDISMVYKDCFILCNDYIKNYMGFIPSC